MQSGKTSGIELSHPPSDIGDNNRILGPEYLPCLT